MIPREEVCSLHLAKKLKKLYAPQKSEYCWVRGLYGFGVIEKWDRRRKHYTSAYIEEEIFEMSPDYIWIGGSRYELVIEDASATEHRIYFSDGTHIWEEHIITARTAVNARAEMLIHLLEQKIVNPEDLHYYY